MEHKPTGFQPSLIAGQATHIAGQRFRNTGSLSHSAGEGTRSAGRTGSTTQITRTDRPATGPVGGGHEDKRMGNGARATP
jgi:hypothetical protein